MWLILFHSATLATHSGGRHGGGGRRLGQRLAATENTPAVTAVRARAA